MSNLQVLLACGIVGVYLVDSARFLAIGDAVVITRCEHSWRLSFGWPFELAGRRPYLPNPLTPFWPDLRVQWTSHSLGSTPPEVASSEMAALLQLTRPISRLAALAGLFVVVIAPVVLVLGHEGLFIVTAGIAFLLGVAACCILGFRRASLRLSWSQVITMSLAALLCLPCAANLGRTILRQQCWTLRVSSLPELGFDESDAGQIRRRVCTFLLEVRRLFPADTTEYSALSGEIGLLERARHEYG